MFVPMSIRKNQIPAAPEWRRTMISAFKGADLYSSPTSIDLRRSPNCPNMVRSVPDKVRKRMGYRLYRTYEGRINGHYVYNGREVIHAGTRLYVDGKEVSAALNDSRSCGFCFNDRLYVLDGANYVYLDGETFGQVKDIAYVPRTVISKNPDGSGGAVLEGINILSDRWTESFYGQKDVKAYQLSFAGLSDEKVAVRVMENNGIGWKELQEGSAFTVDRVSGQVVFTTAPGASPVEGQDNVYITAARDLTAQREKVIRSDTCITYGEAGTGARVFVTGYEKYPNRDFWCAVNDPTYFPDLNYSVLGQSNARIMGYSLLGDRLAAHKNDAEGTVYIRCGESEAAVTEHGATVREMVFRTGNVITGRGAVSRFSFASLGSEPLFLTGRGICALTASDLTGEKYEQNRSFYIDPALAKEEKREEAVATVYRDFYVLAYPSGRVYLLDGLQKAYNRDQPYSSYQYECFYWTGIFARCLWTEGDMLCFGDEEGHVYHFYTDPADPASYNDCGVPIEGVWQTPDLDGSLFYQAKTYRRFSVYLSSEGNTSIEAYYRKDSGEWQYMEDNSLEARRFYFSSTSAALWDGDDTNRIVSRRLMVRKAGSLTLRLMNTGYNEPFGLEAMALEYTQSGVYKK
jgi:hypothetical protein